VVGELIWEELCPFLAVTFLSRLAVPESRILKFHAI